jgi:hypothetical protein
MAIVTYVEDKHQKIIQGDVYNEGPFIKVTWYGGQFRIKKTNVINIIGTIFEVNTIKNKDLDKKDNFLFN